MGFLKFTFFWGLLCFSVTISAQYIQVDDTYSAQQLVEDVLINNACAGVSNFTVEGDPFGGSTQSYGFFINNSLNFPFAEGIVLSTAPAYRSQGPNDNLIDEGSVNWTGDSDLEQALGISNTFNATKLEFDFTPLTSQISFDYIFASEEYSGTAPCRYSDGFAFLLKPIASTLPYQNLAVVPNTNDPVLVTSVHPAIGGGNGCEAINEQYFNGYNPSEYPTNYSGQTVVLTAKATVIPGTTYHIKLVIADHENIRYDSAIFLGGGTFNVGTDLGGDRLFATNNPLCAGENYVLDATEPGNNTYKWFKDTAQIPGETNPTYTVLDSGVYSVEINLNSSGCFVTGKATIEYAALPIVASPVSLIQCDDNNDGISVFNLTKLNDLIRIGNAQLNPPIFFLSLADAQAETNPIQNPSAFANNTTNQVFARVTNSYGCVSYATVNLGISNNVITNLPIYQICDTDTDGIATFTLTDVDQMVLQGLPPASYFLQYYQTETDAIQEINAISINSFTNTTPFQQDLFVRIINGPDCYGITKVRFIVKVFSPANFEDTIFYLCPDDTKVLQVANNFVSYLWNTGETSPSITISSAAIYTVIVTNSDGCSATKTFNVIASEIATITSIDINDFSGNGNTVLVNYTGNGNYQFSLDGNNYQDSALFTNVAAGVYNVFIKDVNGCGITDPIEITVLDYPRYFTPNGDGFHDIWEIKNLNSQPNAVVNIFDRYGKLIYSFKGSGTGWDGKLNGANLPSTDYWFTAILQNGRSVKSHFSLKR